VLLKPQINPQYLHLFAQACSRHNLLLSENRVVRDLMGHSTGTLEQGEGGMLHLRIDTDPRYSTIAERLGSDCGQLIQTYAELVVEEQAVLAGGYLSSREVEADGSVVLTVQWEVL
jgi:hypothetical protein